MTIEEKEKLKNAYLRDIHKALEQNDMEEYYDLIDSAKANGIEIPTSKTEKVDSSYSIATGTDDYFVEQRRKIR